MKKTISSYDHYKFNFVKRSGIEYNKYTNIPSSNYICDGQKFECFEESRVGQDQSSKFIPSFIFFEPDYFLSSENEWVLVGNNVNKKFDLDKKKIVKIKKIVNDDFNFKLDISINWIQHVVFKKDFDLKVENVDLNSFKEQLESFKFSNNFYINGSINNTEEFAFFYGDYLKKSSSFNFSGDVLFFHDICHSKKISITFQKKTNAKKLKKKKVSIRLPSKSVLDLWKEGESYFKNNVVYYNDKFYLCLDNNVQARPDNNRFWKLYEGFGSSFLNSEYGKKAIEVFNNSLNPFVEKFLGDEVIVDLVDVEIIPNLNDSFFLYNKNYRIVEILKNNINGRSFLKVKGREILRFESINFDMEKPTSFIYDIDIKNYNDKKFLSLVYPSNESIERNKSFVVNNLNGEFHV